MNSGQQGSKCERCGKVSPCTRYTFYFGIGKRKTVDVFTRSYQVTVGGSRAAWICEACFWRSVIFHPMPWLLLFTPFIVTIAQSINYVQVPLGRVLILTLAMYAIYYLFSAHSKYHLLEFWYGAGSRQAMKVYKRILNGQGYNMFWTPGVYEKFTTKK
ncbi:MAG TPA: hypothetical protein PLY85_09580 [Anaerolineaceae bacterium]|nr:hypothetical protein [Anaerolineaceae bacterium]HQP09260.1 hypothetical protein [Anaerolineaceae bacterium]